MNDPRKTDYIADFDAEAVRFLEHYGYGRLAYEPHPIPIREIAEKKMMLSIVDTECLSPDESVQGIITFTGGIIDVFDLESEKYIGYAAFRDMMFVDARISNMGRVNNTLAHECFHWYKHRHYFLYKELHEKREGNEFGFRCMVKDGNADRIEDYSDEDRMEYQARAMAPKILMPKAATKKKIEEIYIRYRSQNVETPVADVIDALSIFFRVSKQSAAIRMTELGYSEAKPYCVYVDDTEQNYGSPNSSKAVCRQQTISISEAFRLYQTNEFFRLVLDTGGFQYLDGYFIRKNPKYLKKENGHPLQMTEYAKNHLAECTLDISTRLVREGSRNASEGILFRNDESYKRIASFDPTAQNTENYNLAKALQNIEREFNEQFELHQVVHESTTQRFWRYMQAKKWNTAIFQSRTLLNPMDYKRVQDSAYTFKIPAYTAMAVGLELPLSAVNEALQLSGMGYDLKKKDHFAYTYVLTAFQGCSIDECNEVLKQLQVPLLGAKSRQ